MFKREKHCLKMKKIVLIMKIKWKNKIILFDLFLKKNGVSKNKVWQYFCC